MSLISPSKTSAKAVPTGPLAATILDEWARERGRTPLTQEEASALPPWTEQEAIAFERTINDLFEQIEAFPE